MCNNIIYSDKCCNIVVTPFQFEQGYVYYYILQYNLCEEIPQVVLIEESRDIIKFKSKKDGYYTLCVIRIPTDSEDNPYYFRDGKILRNNGETIEEVELQELLEVNPTFSKIEPKYFLYFNFCNLWKAYVDEASKFFKLSKCNKQESTYTRDLLWSAINVIKYLLKNCKYEEALEIVDRLSVCNGIYNNGNRLCLCGN